MVWDADELLARALGAERSRVVIVTKCGIPFVPEEKKFGRNSTYAHIVESAEESLQRMKTNYLDVLLIHWPDPSTPIEETMHALVDLQHSGKVRYVGVSNFSVPQVEQALASCPLAVQQIGYNLFDRRREGELPWLREHGIGVMAYGPLAQGLLTGTFTANTTFQEQDWRATGRGFGLPIFERENLIRNVAVVDQLKSLARENGRSVAQLAIAWVLRRSEVTTALIGARKPSEIDDSAHAADWRLSPADLARVEEIMRGAAGSAAAI